MTLFDVIRFVRGYSLRGLMKRPALTQVSARLPRPLPRLGSCTPLAMRHWFKLKPFEVLPCQVQLREETFFGLELAGVDAATAGAYLHGMF